MRTSSKSDVEFHFAASAVLMGLGIEMEVVRANAFNPSAEYGMPGVSIMEVLVG